jgi:hypothetical protein
VLGELVTVGLPLISGIILADLAALGGGMETKPPVGWRPDEDSAANRGQLPGDRQS